MVPPSVAVRWPPGGVTGGTGGGTAWRRSATVAPCPPPPGARPGHRTPGRGRHWPSTTSAGTGPDSCWSTPPASAPASSCPWPTHSADRFRCWALDLRGHGRSGRPPDGDFAWSGFATDVLTAVDAPRARPPVAFGHSCGGASLLLAEERRPGTFRVALPLRARRGPRLDRPPRTRLWRTTRCPRGARAGARRSRPPRTPSSTSRPSRRSGTSTPTCCAGYVEDGFEVVPAEEGGDGGSIRLRCRREDEAEVYRRGFDNGAFEHLGEVGCPRPSPTGRSTDAFGARSRPPTPPGCRRPRRGLRRPRALRSAGAAGRGRAGGGPCLGRRPAAHPGRSLSACPSNLHGRSPRPR